MVTTLLLDYGCVISLPQTDADLRALESVAPDVDAVAFWRSYWDLRLDYDKGLPDADYWSGVLGRAATQAESETLTALDIAGWSHVDERVVALLPQLAASGVRLGLLSNAPTAISRAMERAPWTGHFASLTFSADLGVAKPEQEAYAAAARALQVEPADIVFVDDRAENVAGAHAFGMAAIHYTGLDLALAELAEHLPLAGV